MGNSLDLLSSPDFVAGCVAGSIGIVVTQPMDVVRIRMQVPKFQGKSISVQLKQIVKTDGFKGLFRGVASPTLTVGVMSAILFQSFESGKLFLRKRRDTGDDAQNERINATMRYYDMILAGGYAGIVSCLITSPTEMIKCVCQLKQGKESASIREELRTAKYLLMTKDPGYGFFRGMWRGFHVTVMRDAPAFMMYFPLYEAVMDRFDRYRETTMVPFFGGGIAGLVSWYVIYPIDVMKTQYQTRAGAYKKSFPHGVVHQAKTRGVASFYKGVSATMLRAGPQHAVVFICYEWVKRQVLAWQKQNEDDLMVYFDQSSVLSSPLPNRQSDDNQYTAYQYSNSARDESELLVFKDNFQPTNASKKIIDTSPIVSGTVFNQNAIGVTSSSTPTTPPHNDNNNR